MAITSRSCRATRLRQSPPVVLNENGTTLTPSGDSSSWTKNFSRLMPAFGVVLSRVTESSTVCIALRDSSFVSPAPAGPEANRSGWTFATSFAMASFSGTDDPDDDCPFDLLGRAASGAVVGARFLAGLTPNLVDASLREAGASPGGEVQGARCAGSVGGDRTSSRIDPDRVPKPKSARAVEASAALNPRRPQRAAARATDGVSILAATRKTVGTRRGEREPFARGRVWKRQETLSGKMASTTCTTPASRDVFNIKYRPSHPGQSVRHPSR